MDYQKIDLKDVLRLELGPEPISSQQFIFKSTPRFYILRIYYKIANAEPKMTSSVSSHSILEAGSNLVKDMASSYFHTFRSCNLRFFNNLVITTKSSDELTESLRGICHTIQSTALHFKYDIEFEELNKMTK